MKVKDLKKILSRYDDEMEIYMAKDAEGNNYHSLYCTELGRYEDGDVYIPEEELTDAMKEEGWGEDDMRPDLPLSLILYP